MKCADSIASLRDFKIFMPLLSFLLLMLLLSIIDSIIITIFIIILLLPLLYLFSLTQPVHYQLKTGVSFLRIYLWIYLLV